MDSTWKNLHSPLPFAQNASEDKIILLDMEGAEAAAIWTHPLCPAPTGTVLEMSAHGSQDDDIVEPILFQILMKRKWQIWKAANG